MYLDKVQKWKLPLKIDEPMKIHDPPKRIYPSEHKAIGHESDPFIGLCSYAHNVDIDMRKLHFYCESKGNAHPPSTQQIALVAICLVVGGETSVQHLDFLESSRSNYTVSAKVDSNSFTQSSCVVYVGYFQPGGQEYGFSATRLQARIILGYKGPSLNDGKSRKPMTIHKTLRKIDPSDHKLESHTSEHFISLCSYTVNKQNEILKFCLQYLESGDDSTHMSLTAIGLVRGEETYVQELAHSKCSPGKQTIQQVPDSLLFSRRPCEIHFGYFQTSQEENQFRGAVLKAYVTLKDDDLLGN